MTKVIPRSKRGVALLAAFTLIFGYALFFVGSNVAYAYVWSQTCYVNGHPETWNKVVHSDATGGQRQLSSKEYWVHVRTGLPDVVHQLRYVDVGGISAHRYPSQLPTTFGNMGSVKRTDVWYWEYKPNYLLVWSQTKCSTYI